jgi:hypothetical protein
MEFFDSQTFHNLSSPLPPPDAGLIGAVLAAMCTAMASHLFVSSAVSTSGYSVASSEEVISELRKLGYGVDITTTPGSIIVSW